MADGYIGLGTKVEFSEDSGSSWTAVPLLSEIGEIPIIGEADEVDVTTYDQTGRNRKYIKGLQDTDDIEFTGVWTAHDDQVAVKELGDSVVDWRITQVDDIAQLTFDGYVSSFTLNPPLDDRQEFMFTVRISGDVTLTVPAP